MGVWVTVVLIGAIALPSLARKKKMQPVSQQQQTVRVDSLSPNNRKRYEYFLTEAARQHAAGNYSAAFDLYEHARNIDSNSATANYYLSLYLTEMKQDSLGLLRLQKAIEQDPENLIFAERLAQYYISKGKYEDAINAYEAVYAKNHSNTDVLRVLAQLYQQQKNFPMMLNTVSRLETEEGESEQFTLTKMRIHEMMDDKKAAYNELKSLVEQHPLDMQYKTMLGNWLMQHDRQKEAFKYFTDVLKEEPDNSYAQMSLYDYYNATKQADLANGMLDKILMSQKTDTQKAPVLDPKEAEKKLKNMKGIIYNLPGKATIEIKMNNKTLYQGEHQVTQFGSQESLAPSMFEDKKAPVKVYFYPQTGAIKQIIQ
jgi:lipopolysaccharide biosynthesis regulator YciM